MVSLLTEAIFCALISLSIASESPAIRATNSAVPLPTPPSGSKAVFINATDPGINWSSGWQTGPSSCSSGTVRTVSANGLEFGTSYTASYNFRGTGIYANLESGDAFFSISVDGGEQEIFGYQSGAVPANCSYDYSKTNLADDTHVFSITALGPSTPDTSSFWTLSVGGLVIIQPNSDSSPSDSTNSVVPLPTPPSGSKVVFVNATDPGINWSPGWQTGPSSCSAGSVRTVSANGFDELGASYTASYNFRGTGIYANLQSGDAFFSISIDSGEQEIFGYQSGVVPANCSYDYSKTNLADETHVFSIMALGPSIPDTNSFWTLSVGGLAIIQPGSGSDSDSSDPTGTSPAGSSNPSTVPSGHSSAQPPSGTNSNPSSSGSAAHSGGGGGLSTTDIIAIVTSIIGGIAGVFGIIGGIYKFRQWRRIKNRPPSQDFLLNVVKS